MKMEGREERGKETKKAWVEREKNNEKMVWMETGKSKGLKIKRKN